MFRKFVAFKFEVSRKKFCKIFSKAILQNPCSKTSLVELVFNKIAGTGSRPATLPKRRFQQEGLLYLQIFNPQNSLT